MDFVSSLIDLARTIGSFLCFQLEEATFTIGGEPFPVCSGCFGIYLGVLIALSSLPFFEKLSRRLFSLKLGLLMILPMAAYWAILNIQQQTDRWIVPGVREAYFLFGVLFGFTIANATYNLCLEFGYANVIRRVGRKFWIVIVLLAAVSLSALPFYSFETTILFSSSFFFLLGLFGLVGFSLVWIISALVSFLRRKD